MPQPSVAGFLANVSTFSAPGETKVPEIDALDGKYLLDVRQIKRYCFILHGGEPRDSLKPGQLYSRQSLLSIELNLQQTIVFESCLILPVVSGLSNDL